MMDPVLRSLHRRPRTLAGTALLLAVLLLAVSLLAGCNQPPLIPAPPDTGPELEAMQLSAGLLSPYRVPGEAKVLLRIQDRLAHYNVPGISIAVIDGGELRWAKSWGVRVAGSDEGMTPETQLQASSIAKGLTATLALRQVDEGVLELDQTVPADLLPADLLPADLLPADLLPADRQGAAPTLRGLLSHLSGLGPQSYAGDPELDSQSLVRLAAPGETMLYSGGGYQLVQSWLESATGSTFAELAEQELLTPLEMTRSVFAVDPQAPWAVGHDGSGEALDGEYRPFPQAAAAGLWTTPTDLAHWLIDLQKAHAGKPGRRLKKATVRQAFTAQEPSPWGLGLQLGGAGQARWVAHSGGNPGYPSLALGFVSSGHGAVIMTNGDGGHGLIREVITGLAEVYQWPAFQQELLEPEIDGVAADSVPVGSYDLPTLPGQAFSIRIDDDGKVHGRLFGSEAALLPLQDGSWIAPEPAYRLRSGQNGVLEFQTYPNFRFHAVPVPDKTATPPEGAGSAEHDGG